MKTFTSCREDRKGGAADDNRQQARRAIFKGKNFLKKNMMTISQKRRETTTTATAREKEKISLGDGEGKRKQSIRTKKTFISQIARGGEPANSQTVQSLQGRVKEEARGWENLAIERKASTKKRRRIKRKREGRAGKKKTLDLHQTVTPLTGTGVVARRGGERALGQTVKSIRRNGRAANREDHENQRTYVLYQGACGNFRRVAWGGSPD